MLTQSDPTLELHERILDDLDRRNALVVEQEAEARKVMEQVLAQCAAERASIDQDRALLTQAGQLYRRFMETNGGGVPEANAAPAELVPQAVSSAPLPDARTRVDRLTLVDSSVESQIASTIRDFRSQLIAEQKAVKVA